MIKYNLKCDINHIFEAWFKNSAAFDDQASAGHVSCTVCGSSQITKAPMAPSVPQKGNRQSIKAADKKISDDKQAALALKALRQVRKTVEDNCDYVGTQFAEEARKIHYGEVKQRGIYGEATNDEKAELADEGVELSDIPWVPNSDA